MSGGSPPRPHQSSTRWLGPPEPACVGYLDLFFSADGEREPDRKNREEQAVALCGMCPSTSRLECLEWALTYPERDGVWGGMTPDELKEERRRRSRKEVAA